MRSRLRESWRLSSPVAETPVLHCLTKGDGVSSAQDLRVPITGHERYSVRRAIAASAALSESGQVVNAAEMT